MTPKAQIVVRRARICDLPALRALQLAALGGLDREGPDEGEIASYIRYVGVIDLQLLAEGSYFVAMAGDTIVAGGGWSAGAPSYDRFRRNSSLPAAGRASVRCVYEHPDHVGASNPILAAIEREHVALGFRETLVATTYGSMPYYGRLGYQPEALLSLALPDGGNFQGVAMNKLLQSHLAQAA